MKTQRLVCELLCPSEEKVKIKHIYCNIEAKRIVFSDLEENVYIVVILEDKFEVSHLGRHHQEISALSMSEKDEVVVVSLSGGVYFWTMNLVQEEVTAKKDEPNLLSYYRGDNFIVHYAKYSEWWTHDQDDEEPENFFVLINNEGRGISEFDMNKFSY